MNKMPTVSKQTLLLQLREKSVKDLAVLYKVTVGQLRYYMNKLGIDLPNKNKLDLKRPFKLTSKLEIAFKSISDNEPFDVAAKKAGITLNYLIRMYNLYKQEETKLEKERKRFNEVKHVLHVASSKNMSQAEACALLGYSLSTFQYNYHKGKAKGVFK